LSIRFTDDEDALSSNFMSYIPLKICVENSQVTFGYVIKGEDPLDDKNTHFSLPLSGSHGSYQARCVYLMLIRHTDGIIQ
jgi:hypothetical protein